MSKSKDIRKDFKKFKEQLETITKELEDVLTIAVSERVEKFKSKYGISPCQIDVGLYERETFGSETDWEVHGVFVVFPLKLDE